MVIHLLDYIHQDYDNWLIQPYLVVRKKNLTKQIVNSNNVEEKVCQILDTAEGQGLKVSSTAIVPQKNMTKTVTQDAWEILPIKTG